MDRLVERACRRVVRDGSKGSLNLRISSCARRWMIGLLRARGRDGLLSKSLSVSLTRSEA